MSMFIAPAVTETSDFSPLDEGCWEGIVVGLRGFTGTKYQSDEPEDKMQFVFQVQDGDGVLHYLTSKPLTNVLTEKSNLFKVLNGITGYGLDKFPVGFNYAQLVNSEKPIKCQLVVKTVPGKKDATKMYNEIDSYLKAKKGQKNQFVPDDKAPAWLNQNVKEVFWINGLSFLPPQEKTQNAKAAIPEAPVTQLGNSSAFFGQAQNPTNPQFAPVQPPSPYVAPQTKAQQVAERQAQPSAYVPPAAPAPQQAWPAQQQPAAPVVDGDDDLPFSGGRA